MIGANRAELQASLARIQNRMAREPQRVFGEMKPLLDDWGRNWKAGVDARFQGVLNSRSGRLKASLQQRVTGSSLNTLKLRMESVGDLSYAKLQEFGGVVRPKNGKFLTIPTGFNKTPAGNTRIRSARDMIASNPGRTFFAESKKGNLLLFLRKGPKSKPKPMFALKTSVEIPGPNAPTKRQASRLGFYDVWNSQKASRAADLVRLGLGGR